MRVTRALTVVLLCLCGPVIAADPPQVSLQTNVGEIVLELDAERAPSSVKNFTDYVNSGFYDGTVFHRVIEGFMIQGGGFTPDFMRKQTESPIRNEGNNGLKNRAYTISMARTNAPHSATSQFFINTVDNSNLDHTEPTARGWGYAVFGRVIDGFDVVDKIGTAATGSAGPFPRDVPKDAIVIESAVVLGGDAINGNEAISGNIEASQTSASKTSAQ